MSLPGRSTAQFDGRKLVATQPTCCRRL